MRLSLIACYQIILYTLLKLPVTLLFHIQRQRNIKLEEGRFLIASNHPSALDPFLVCFALPPAMAFRLIPVRFVTAACYMKSWLHRLLLSSLGCISTEPKNGKVLDELAYAAKRGDTIYFFPSGQRDGSQFVHPKIGVVYLEHQLKDAKIIPIHIGLASTITFQNFITFRIRVKIIVLPPYRHQEFPADLQPLADELMRRIGTAAT